MENFSTRSKSSRSNAPFKPPRKANEANSFIDMTNEEEQQGKEEKEKIETEEKTNVETEESNDLKPKRQKRSSSRLKKNSEEIEQETQSVVSEEKYKRRRRSNDSSRRTLASVEEEVSTPVIPEELTTESSNSHQKSRSSKSRSRRNKSSQPLLNSNSSSVNNSSLSTSQSQLLRDEQFAREIEEQQMSQYRWLERGSFMPMTPFESPMFSGPSFLSMTPNLPFLHRSTPPSSSSSNARPSSSTPRFSHPHPGPHSFSSPSGFLSLLNSNRNNPLLLALSLMNRDFNDGDYELLLRLDEGNNHRGATSNMLDALPKRKLEEKDLKNGEEKFQCSICLEEFEVDNEVKQLPCSHFFHSTCIDQWLKVNKVCPIDKKPIIQESEFKK